MYMVDCVLSYKYLSIYLISLDAALFVSFHLYINLFCIDYSFHVNPK